MIPLSFRISANLLLLRALTQRTDAVVENLTDQLRIASEDAPLPAPSPDPTVSPAFAVGVVVALGAVLYLVRRRRRIR